MVSLIQSNYCTVGFGAGLVADGAGFVLHNRGAGFTLDAGEPERARRVASARCTRSSRRSWRRATCASPSASWAGGTRRRRTRSSCPTSWTIGMNIQGALDAPRFSKETFQGCDVNFESRLPTAVRDSLTAMGHRIVMRGDFSSTRMGAGQAVQRNSATGLNAGASDPRKDGAAVSELLPTGATGAPPRR